RAARLADLAPSARDDVVRGDVLADREQPRPERPAGIVLRDPIIGAEKRLLRDILGLARVGETAREERGEARAIANHELVERAAVAVARARGELLGGWCVRLWWCSCACSIRSLTSATAHRPVISSARPLVEMFTLSSSFFTPGSSDSDAIARMPSMMVFA